MNTIRTLRNYLGYTQREFSTLTGVPVNVISNIEAGLLIPKRQVRQQIVKALGVKPQDILWERIPPDFEDYDDEYAPYDIDDIDFEDDDTDWSKDAK